MAGPGGRLPLTFGIEVEFLFAVRRDIERYPEYWWLNMKNLGKCPHFSANLEGLLKDRCPCPNCYASISHGLYQTAAIFGNNGGELRVDEDAKMDDESFEKFDRWGLTHESAVVIPENESQSFRWSGGAFSGTMDQLDDEWNFTGLELVSPALVVPDIANNRLKGLTELQGYLKFMTAKSYPEVPYIFMAHPQNTSVHVHIGVQPETSGQVDIPLGVLRHTAWLCVFFEDSLTLLHHPERHAYATSKSRDYAYSNRKVLCADGKRHLVHTCGLGRPFSPEDAFMKIFDYEYLDDELARQKLAEALSCKANENERPIDQRDIQRYLFVNFENLALQTSEHSKRTIEFRQHHGTLSAEDMKEWVMLLTALVRAAERMDSSTLGSTWDIPPRLVSKIYGKWQEPDQRFQALREAAKYAHLLKKDRRSLKQLFDLLELPLRSRIYWWNRAKKFQAEIAQNWAHKLQATCDDLYCPNKPLRDSEGWEQGELDEAPWDGADDDCEFELDEVKEGVDSVAMELDGGPDPQDLVPRSTLGTAPNSIPDNGDDEDVPMDIDDDDSSPVSILPVVPARTDCNVMSIVHILNHLRT